MRNVFWRYTILWLPILDRNDICSLPRATKRKGSADLRPGSRSSLPDLIWNSISDRHPRRQHGSRSIQRLSCRNVTAPFFYTRSGLGARAIRAIHLTGQESRNSMTVASRLEDILDREWN